MVYIMQVGTGILNGVQEICNLRVERHPSRKFCCVCLKDLFRKFQEIGAVVNKKRQGLKIVVEEKQVEFLGQVANNRYRYESWNYYEYVINIGQKSIKNSQILLLQNENFASTW